MPTKKIADPCDSDSSWCSPKCHHPDHEPARMVVRPSGTYEHECPACHAKTTFTVSAVRWVAGKYERKPIPGDIGIPRFTVGTFVLDGAS